jgi:hypothetical protein
VTGYDIAAVEAERLEAADRLAALAQENELLRDSVESLMREVRSLRLIIDRER